MKPSSQRAISFIISLAFLVGAVLVYGMFIAPSYERIQNLRSQQVLKSKEYNAQAKAVKDLKDLQQKFDDLRSAKDTVSLSLPNDPNTPQLINTLSGLATISSIDIRNINIKTSSLKSFGNPSFVRNVGTARAQFKAFGTYKNVKTFINHIERNVRIMDIKSFNISPAKDAEESQNNESYGSTSVENISENTMAFDIDLQAYYQEPLPIQTKKTAQTSK